MDMDTAYENGAFIPDSASYPEKWEEAAQAWREVESAVGRARLNIPYGNGERNAFDLFYPAGKPKGLVVFVHGGYWRAFDRKSWSHLARGVTAHGWVMAIPSYSLAPIARVSEITLEVAKAVEVAANMVAGPIVLTGHSAGGHLVARMMCGDVDLSQASARRIARCIPISPLADLTPLLDTKLNLDLHLDQPEAVAESPVNCAKIRDGAVTVWVGAEERPAFLDQAGWLCKAWPTARLHVAPGRHHFDVIEEFEEPDSALVNALLQGL